MYVTVHKTIPVLLERKLIKLEKKGKANLISVDFENAKIGDLSSAILPEKDTLMKKYPQIALLIKDIEGALSGKLYILLLFGSYAKEIPRQSRVSLSNSKEFDKKESDVDLLFIISDRRDIE